MQGDAKDRLKTTGRPGQVTEFLAYHRRLDRRPVIRDVQRYARSWEVWHRELKAETDYQALVRGGGNGISLLILAFRWWADTAAEMEEGEAKEDMQDRLQEGLRDLEATMSGVLGSGTLERVVNRVDSEEEDSEEESRPKKR